jgi:hypothetical protein
MDGNTNPSKDLMIRVSGKFQALNASSFFGSAIK